jgi:CheY-like chemotaxis protein
MKNILITSSSRPFLNRNKNLLTRSDFQIFTATSANDALRLYQELPFDLIISDTHLDGMGGNDLCTSVRALQGPRNTAFILICMDTPDDHRRADQSGADAKIIRPIQPEQMLETVGSLLEMKLGRTRRAIFKVMVISKKGEVKFYCESIDISISGMLLETEYHLVLGDRIICQFTLPGASQIVVDGDVARTIKTPEGMFRYGIQFIGLPVTARRDIEKYIATVVK